MEEKTNTPQTGAGVKVPQEPHYVVPDKDGKPIYKLLKDVIDIGKDTWKTKDGVQIISLAGLQKIANAEGIIEHDFQTEITPTADNKQQHAVNIWLGFRNSDSKDWVRGSGEASELNTGIIDSSSGSKVYIERGRVDSSYRFAMADKRAFSRALAKLVQLTGFYCEVEAQEFAEKNKIDDYDNL